MEATYKDLRSIVEDAPNLDDFQAAISNGLSGPEFSRIIASLSRQLHIFSKLDQEIVPMQDETQPGDFIMDLSSLLQELQCPYENLVSSPLNERFSTPENRLLALDFLVGELQTARINYVKYGPDNKNTKPLLEDDVKKIIASLGMAPPPADITMERFFFRLDAKLKELLAVFPPNHPLLEPLLKQSLSAEQWRHLEQINKQMCAEYRLRREMLLKRCDVTVQSFFWSEKIKAKEAELKNIYSSRRQEMTEKSLVSVSDILSARGHLLNVEKTSSHNVRKYTKSAVNRVLMGDVPDRGGRPSAGLPLGAAEMPNFRPREQGGGDHRGGGRGGHGGRVQYGRGRGGHRGGRGDRW